jgi:hypothetical protein
VALASVSDAVALQALAQGPVPDACKEAFYSLLGGPNIVLAVEGARRFESPPGIGVGSYDGCHITVFQEDLDEVGPRLAKALKATADKELREGTHSVYLFREVSQEEECHTYVAQLEPPQCLAQFVHQGRVARARGQVRQQVGRRDQRAFAQDHRLAGVK